VDTPDGIWPMIEVRIKKAFPTVAINAEFASPADGITALFGRNGAGKSSVVAGIAGALTPDEGRISVAGRVFFDSAAGINLAIEQRRLGYVFQDSRLFPHLNVQSNLLFGLKRFRGTAAIKPDTVFELLGLGQLLTRRPHTLSGGERQRVAIGRAILAQPALLLMDEPLAALDPPRKAELLPYIELIRTELGLPVIYISHDFNEVMRLADHLVVMDQGRVARHGPLIDMASDPDMGPLIGRFEAGTVIDATVSAHMEDSGLSKLTIRTGRVAGGGRDLHALLVPRVDAPPGTSMRVRIRTRDVALALSEPLDTSISNRLPGTITHLSPREGPFVDATVDVGGAVIRALVTTDSVQRLGLEPGKNVWVLFKAAALDSRSVGFTRRARGSALQS